MRTTRILIIAFALVGNLAFTGASGAQGKYVSSTKTLPASRPASEPFATCYDRWEALEVKKSPYDGRYYYPDKEAYEIHERHPSCFFVNKQLTRFPVFPIGPKGNPVRNDLCLSYASYEYEKAYSSNPDSAVQNYLGVMSERTGVYCVKNGRPLFEVDAGDRPLYPSEAECNKEAQARAKRYELPNTMRPLCFDQDGQPRFSVSIFSGVGAAKKELLTACPGKFEEFAAAHVRMLNDPDLKRLMNTPLADLSVEQEEYLESIDEYLQRGGAVKEFIQKAPQCFKDGRPKFSFQGGYSNHPKVKEILDGEAAFYDRLKRLSN